jgi:polyhydroxyalkanoate synthesis regulator phasin
MIVASGKVTQESAVRYMKAMMEMYQNAYRAMPSPLTAFMPAMWGQEKGTNGAPQAPATNPGTPAGPPQPEQSPEVVELRRRVEELEATLSRRKPAKKARKKKSRR